MRAFVIFASIFLSAVAPQFVLSYNIPQPSTDREPTPGFPAPVENPRPNL